jgi:cytochrome c oxidase cbb3-type subunit III
MNGLVGQVLSLRGALSPAGRLIVTPLCGLCLLASSCGEPPRLAHTPVPQPEMNFNKLFAENCSGCHGENGRHGSAPQLNDPVYLAIADRDSISNTIKYGRSGTPMPAMGKDAGGGPLSDEQVGAIVDGMEREWSRGVHFEQTPPVYSVEKAPPGDAQKGEAAYQKNCMMCHGFGSFKGAAGAILDPHFLALVSDQALRTTMIAGWPDWGMPDWRNRIPGHPMTDQDISDVVAWLASQRPHYSGETKE